MLVLWDSDADASGLEGVVYSWNGHNEIGTVYSLLRYAETNSDRLRCKYLSFTHELGESQINGKRLIDHLVLKDGLSYWWMTTFVEQHCHTLPLVDAIRLLALEEILVQRKPKKFFLVSANRNLHKALKNLCQGLEIKYEWQKQKKESSTWNRERFYKLLPQPIETLIALTRHLRMGWGFREAETTGWFDDNAMLLCGYFANVDPEKAIYGRFYSRYWGGLLGLMKELGIKTNWLHHNAVYNRKTAMNWTSHFNCNKEGQGFHTFLNAYLSWSVIINVIRKWVFLNVVYWRLRNIKNAFRLQGTQLSFWPLMKIHWQDSLRGPTSIANLLSIELFDRAIKRIPYQKLGLFLYENHAWERALIHAWRKHGHGQLIAVAHSTVRFWDLRYFIDSRTIHSSKCHAMPQSDRIALNGNVALEAYLSVNYPKKNLIECEALRYSYLNTLPLLQPSMIKKEIKIIQMLILGDILFSATNKMLRMLEEAMSYSTLSLSLTLKPHPMCPINIKDYPRLALNMISDPLEKIMHNYDIAYASDSTSAAADAYFVGLPVLVVLDDKKLNFSPLRNQPGVYFVSTSKELEGRLQITDLPSTTGSASNDFFFLDPKLRRWKKLLSLVFQMNNDRTIHKVSNSPGTSS